MTISQKPKARKENGGTAPAAWARDLFAAAEAGNEAAFAQAVRDVNWGERAEEDFEAAVQLALAAGAHGAARALADEGFRIFPGSERLRKTATILAPPRVTGVRLPANPSAAANQEWLRANAGRYRGCWVALRDGSLLSAAPSLEEVRRQVGEIRNSGLFVTRVAG